MVAIEIVKLLGNLGDRCDFKCADASAIPVGAFLELSDANTVTAHATNVDTPIVGICSREKVANDGELFVTGITNCLFKAVVDGANVTVGDICSCGSTTNEVETGSSLDFEKGWAVGWSRENASSADTCLFRSTF